jgi:hypothetical protein
MAHKYLRFIAPIVFAVAGVILAGFLIQRIVESLVAILPNGGMYDLIGGPLTGRAVSDVNWILTYIPIITIAEYLILGLPIAAILLLGTMLIRSTAYDISILELGEDFGSIRMIRRSVIPALFALSLGGVVSSLLRNYIFTEVTNLPPPAIPFYYSLIQIVSALILLPVVLGFFIPTWLLNDAGIVMHLKDEELRVRRCPDTIGVGRWLSNLLGGFTLLTIPILAFVNNFIPIIAANQLSITSILTATLQSFGLPIVAMAYVIPVIVFNEILLRFMRRAVRRIAKAFGANEISLATVTTPAIVSSKKIMKT